MPYRSMSLRKKNRLLKNTIIKYDMNKRSQPISKKYFFHPPGVINFLTSSLHPQKHFNCHEESRGKRILTLSALSRSCQFLPLSDRTKSRCVLLDGTMKDEIDILQKIAAISPDSECNLGVDDFFDVTPTHKPSLQNINNFMVNANLSNSELLNFDASQNHPSISLNNR